MPPMPSLNRHLKFNSVNRKISITLNSCHPSIDMYLQLSHQHIFNLNATGRILRISHASHAHLRPHYFLKHLFYIYALTNEFFTSAHLQTVLTIKISGELLGFPVLPMTSSLNKLHLLPYKIYLSPDFTLIKAYYLQITDLRENY